MPAADSFGGLLGGAPPDHRYPAVFIERSSQRRMV
jgi:hypothetical protein